MNWDALGAISEAIGALAVVVTLVYLATQIRYAKLAASDSKRLTRANGVRDMYMAQAQDPSLSMALAKFDPVGDGYWRSYADAYGASVEEAICVDSQNHYYFWLHWGQFASSKTPEDIAELRNVVRGFYTVPYVRHSWENAPYAKRLLEPRFVEFVDAIISEADADAGDGRS